MSGGTFNYKQYVLDEIICTIENAIEENGKPIPYEQLDYFDRQTLSKKEYEANPRLRHEYSQEVLNRFRHGLEIVKSAAVFIDNLDYFMACDIGEETFLRRTMEIDSMSISKLTHSQKN